MRRPQSWRAKEALIRWLASIQPMGAPVERSLRVFLDILVIRLMERQKIVSATMLEGHANLEWAASRP